MKVPKLNWNKKRGETELQTPTKHKNAKQKNLKALTERGEKKTQRNNLALQFNTQQLKA